MNSKERGRKTPRLNTSHRGLWGTKQESIHDIPLSSTLASNKGRQYIVAHLAMEGTRQA